MTSHYVPPFMHGCSVCKCQWPSLEAIRAHECPHKHCQGWHVELMPIGTGMSYLDREALATVLGAPTHGAGT